MVEQRKAEKILRHLRVNRVRSIALGGAVLAAAATVRGQLATVDKGHQILLDNGLQIWGLYSDPAYDFDYSVAHGANLTGVMFWSGTRTDKLAAGDTWAKRVISNPDGTLPAPSTVVTPAEQPFYNDLIGMAIGDEQQYDIENGSNTKNWFLAAGNGTATTADDVFPHSLLFINSFFINSDTAYANFIATANPDAISFDSYPFGDANGAPITPTNWLALAQHFRRHALGSYIGATGNAARPYGLYLQTYHAESEHVVDPGDVQMRWQQFTAWTMGFTFVDAFIFQGGNNHFYDRSTPLYSQFAESARQGRNLGPALTRLISTGYGPQIVPGQNADGSGRGVPGDWLMFNQFNAPTGQLFLASLSATNLGSKNNGKPGDVYVGFFNPLLGASANPQGEAYFMVTNALGGDLKLPDGSSDNQALVSETQQAVTLNFDFVGTRITSLQRLRRSDGQLEVVPLTANGGSFGSLYKTTVTLDGGTGDLFKFNDGSPFVGVERLYHWDPDSTAAGNDPMSGAGVGGAGNWDGAGTKFSDGATNSDASAGRHVVFWGPTGGTVVLSAGGQSAYSLTFKTDGYSLAGGTLTMEGPAVTVDAGVTATIGSAIAGGAGLNKLGPGTLVLSVPNTYAGGTYVGGGLLRISADNQLAPAPALPGGTNPLPVDNIFLNNGGLQFAASFALSGNRGIELGASGGTIDVMPGVEVTYNSQKGFRGYDLIKTGPGTFFASATSGGVNNVWAGSLIIREGTWKVVASDGLPLNPTGGGLRPTQVTLDGGTWQWAAGASVTNANRGITVAAGGGTIDVQGFVINWAGPLLGSVPSAVLNKIGTGTLTLNATTFASTYPGTFNLNAGTLNLNNGQAMGDAASLVLAASGVTLNLGGSETIGSLAGGGTVALNSFTLATGGNGKSTTFAGTLAGAGGNLIKFGTGTFTLAAANTYTGTTTVNQGVLELTGAGTIGSGGLAINTGGVLRLAPGGPATLLRLPSITSGQVDFTDRHVIIDFPPGDASGAVRNYLQSGRSGGSWNGTGIVSSTAAADPNHLTAIGWVRQSDLDLDAWGGAAAPHTSILLRYTYYGDANLDGVVNADDFALADRGLARGTGGWIDGDFDYDGTVTSSDFLLMDAAYGSQGGPLTPEFLADRQARFGDAYVSDLMAAVPEPSTLALATIPAVLSTRRRRRA